MISKTKKRTTPSGRKVTHSRGGCLTCKKRKLRCPENKPICSRCYNDNRPCSYGVLLQWEDDSRKRGIKHGRTTRADRAGLSVSESSMWLTFPQGQGGKHFVNTFISDIEGKISVPMVEGLDFEGGVAWRTETVLYASPAQKPTLHFADERDKGINGLLFDYYDTSLSHSIPLLDSSTNLFRNLILPLSTSSESIMHMIIALSALSLTATTGKSHFYPTALRHKQRSMQIIREQIASNAIAAANDANVIVILLLCIFEISDNCQVSWSTHLCAALDLMRLARSSNSADLKLMRINPQVTEFVSRFFLVKDALGRTACGKVAKIKHEIPPVDSSEIDPSIGCSYELVGIISKITDLARDMRNPEVDSNSWYTETLKLEEQLNALIQHLPSISFRLPDTPNLSLPRPTITITTTETEPASTYSSAAHPDETAILYNTSHLIRASATLYFQATLRSLNPYTAQARALIAPIIEYTRNLSPNYLRSAHLWPLFVGAVYSTGDDEERVWFLNQFDILAGEQRALVARGALTRVKEIVESVWKRRDLDLDHDGAGGGSVSGTYQQQRGKIGGLEIGDWEKYVQPLSEGLCLG